MQRSHTLIARLSLCLVLIGTAVSAAAQAQVRRVAVPMAAGTAPASKPAGNVHTWTGSVTDEQGKPIAGATLTCYITDYSSSNRWSFQKAADTMSGEDGRYTLRFDVGDGSKPGRAAMMLVKKAGLAMDWDNWTGFRESSRTANFTLGPPKSLGGTVTDGEGKPIAGAQVAAIAFKGEGPENMKYAMGLGLDDLTTTTGPEGRFTFDSLPGDAAVEFLLTAPGRATTLTIDLARQMGPPKFQFHPGQADLRLKMDPEGKIRGTVVVKATSQPAAGIPVTALSMPRPLPFANYAAISDEKGQFTISGLGAGQYQLHLVSMPDKVSDWSLQPVPAEVTAGKTTEGITLQVAKGAVVEFKVTDDAGKPVEGARTHISPPAGGGGVYADLSASTDSAGIARLRLPPGKYGQQNVQKDGLAFFNSNEALELEEGQTKAIEVTLKSLPKVRGVVRDEQGNPVAGAAVRVLPNSHETATTAADGSFSILAASPWGGMSYGSAETQPTGVLVVRHVERDLAASARLDDANSVQVVLHPAVSLEGQVQRADGSPAGGARLTLFLYGDRWGASPTGGQHTADPNGHYRIATLPPGWRYQVLAEADRCGSARVDLTVEEDAQGTLKMDDLTLPAASKAIAGTVVDGDDKPVANAQIYVYGQSQPSRNAMSDSNGAFTIDGIVDEGSVQVNAQAMNSNGMVYAQGGDTEVRIVLGQHAGSRSAASPRPRTLLGKPLPDLKDAGLAKPIADAQSKRVLLCVWDYQQRPSRYAVQQLAGMADGLKAKGVVVLFLQTSEADPPAVKGWLEKQKITLPVGQAPPGAQKSNKFLLDLGVGALPWLILTDDQHIVRAEGFELSELDAKLAPSEK